MMSRMSCAAEEKNRVFSRPETQPAIIVDKRFMQEFQSCDFGG
jgi:hypothetical protein